MTEDFYLAFENTFRGSRELIRSRLQVYEPFVRPLREQLGPRAAMALDLGCGRGEWLELLQDCGFTARGVDLNEAMLATCRDRGLTVQCLDALACLRQLPANSQAVVSGFHIIEHLPFPDLQCLVQEALRVLMPGGLLILETPNTENLVVGTSNFYLDPTHLRPIPAELLLFLTRHTGFKRSKVLRLNAEKENRLPQRVGIVAVLHGVSPDYAVVAQKDGAQSVLQPLSPAFQADYGVSLDALARHQQQQIEARFAQLEARAIETQRQTEARFAQLETRFAQAEARADAAQAQVVALLSSTSWRLTRPVRWLGSRVKQCKMALKPRARTSLHKVAAIVQCFPWLKRGLLVILNHLPWLKARVAAWLHQVEPQVALDPIHLTPQARHIHQKLKAGLTRGAHSASKR